MRDGLRSPSRDRGPLDLPLGKRIDFTSIDDGFRSPALRFVRKLLPTRGEPSGGFIEENMYKEMVIEGKSRYEIIMRALVSYREAGARTSQRDWVNRELAEIGMAALSDEEIKTHTIVVAPRLL